MNAKATCANPKPRIGQRWIFRSVDSAPALGRKGGVGRSYADAPEIDGTVKLLPPEKASKTLKVGEFTKARIVGGLLMLFLVVVLGIWDAASPEYEFNGIEFGLLLGAQGHDLIGVPV